MTKRLETIYSMITDGIGVADIGTDHGYIPIKLAQNGFSGNIIASDINRMPIETAKRNAEEANVSDRINFLISDGLSAITPNSIDTVIIAGLGGDLICRILDRAEWIMDSHYKLILQPMTKAEVLRYWLVNNGISIESDIPVKDMGKLYSIICARFTSKNTGLSDSELYTGERVLIRNSCYFDEIIELNSERMMKIAVGLRLTGAESFRLDFYDSILNGLFAMKNNRF